MKKIYNILGVLIIIALVVFIGVKSSGSASVDNKQIVIGAVVSQTGYAAVDGMNIKNGMDMAVDDLRKEGVDVKIVYEDDATDPKQTVSAVNKLISADKVDALMGPTWSFLIDAALPIINTNKTVTVIPSDSSEIVNGTSSYTFYGTYKNIEETDSITKLLREKNLKTVAIVTGNDLWGESHTKAFVKATEIVGGKIIIQEKINYGSDKEVIPTIIAKIIKANPDVVMWTGYDEAGTILMKKLQEQNFNKPIIAAGSVMRGLVKREVVVLRPADEVYTIDIPMDPSFRTKYIAKYNQEPGVFADSAYDSVKILVKGLQTGKRSDDLANYLRNDFSYKGFLGNYDFDASGDIVGGNWVINRLTK